MSAPWGPSPPGDACLHLVGALPYGHRPSVSVLTAGCPLAGRPLSRLLQRHVGRVKAIAIAASLAGAETPGFVTGHHSSHTPRLGPPCSVRQVLTSDHEFRVSVSWEAGSPPATPPGTPVREPGTAGWGGQGCRSPRVPRALPGDLAPQTESPSASSPPSVSGLGLAAGPTVTLIRPGTFS